MFVARDTEGTLIWADEANKQTDYFCPVCCGQGKSTHTISHMKQALAQTTGTTI